MSEAERVRGLVKQFKEIGRAINAKKYDDAWDLAHSGAHMAEAALAAEPTPRMTREQLDDCMTGYDAGGTTRTQLLERINAALAAEPTREQERKQLLHMFVGYLSVEYGWEQQRWENCGKLADLFLAALAKEGK